MGWTGERSSHVHELRSAAEATPTREVASSRADAQSFTLESCHSTWLFEPGRGRFRRILKIPGVSPVLTQWRPYVDLELDPDGDTFVVVLNAARTRLLTSWCHRGPRCPWCDEQPKNGTAHSGP